MVHSHPTQQSPQHSPHPSKASSILLPLVFRRFFRGDDGSLLFSAASLMTSFLATMSSSRLAFSSMSKMRSASVLLIGGSVVFLLASAGGVFDLADGSSSFVDDVFVVSSAGSGIMMIVGYRLGSRSEATGLVADTGGGKGDLGGTASESRSNLFESRDQDEASIWGCHSPAKSPKTVIAFKSRCNNDR